MNMKFFATTAAAAIILTSTQAMAATVTFDNFSTNQVAADEPTVLAPNTSTVAGGPGSGFQGVSRTFDVENTKAEGNPAAATTLETFNGILSFDNDSGARGKGMLTYSGVGDLGANVNNGSFIFEVIDFDGNARFTLNGTDTENNMVSYAEDLFDNFNPVLRFSELTGAQTFNFGSVATLSFAISSMNTADSIDGRLASIQIGVDDMPAVPLPASGLLLLGALGGAAALRRRKATKAA